MQAVHPGSRILDQFVIIPGTQLSSDLPGKGHGAWEKPITCMGNAVRGPANLTETVKGNCTLSLPRPKDADHAAFFIPVLMDQAPTD